MKKNNSMRLLSRILVCLIAVLILVPTFGAAAVSEKTDEIGYESYTYWYNFTGKTNRVVPTKPMYTVGKVITSLDLSCTGASTIDDSHVSSSGITYVLDGGASRIIVLDQEYNIIREITAVVMENGTRLDFWKAKGIFVDEYENLFIADTQHQRVLKCDAEGNFIRVYELPKEGTSDARLIPDGFNYQPIKVAVDQKGYVYILSNGSYYGAILYSPEDKFLGFYGANDVPATFTQALTTLWNRLFMNNEKRAEMTRSLPYTFSDLWVDGEGFVYTATSSTNEPGQTAQIKRLNPGGTNILPSDSINFVDDEIGNNVLTKSVRFQSLVGVAADDDGFIYTIDTTYGRVYVYDSECNLISTFGGGLKGGNQDGTFYNACSISYNKETQDVIITDNSQDTITIFNITDYGKLIKSAQAKTVVGDYEEAMAEWTEVLAADRNCQMAYAGLARAYYAMGKTAATEEEASVNYDKAIELAQQGYDRETYSLAFASVRTEWLRDNFTLVIVVAVVILAALIALLVYSTKRKMRLVKNEKAHIATTLLTHPFENFRDMKEKGLTSIPICLVIVVLYYVFDVMETTMGGFAFTYFDPSSYNALLILAKTAGLVILWTVTNWAVCTLFSGKGKINEIFSVICYSLIPSLLGSIIYIVCSNVLVPDEAAFLSVLTVICTGYTVILLAAGSMIVHDYGLLKFIGTTLLTLLGCAIVIFLLIAVAVLLQQLGGFVGTIYTEILKLF